MKVKRTEDGVSIMMSGAEACVLLHELLDVPGGARLPKLRQVCHELGLWFQEAQPVRRARRSRNSDDAEAE